MKPPVKIKISIPHHTVIQLTGPTCVGKSTLTAQIKQYAKVSNISCRILSSDEIRRDLLNADEDECMRTSEAQGVSDQAFDMLLNQLKNYMSFPVNMEIIVVDTTGLDFISRNIIDDLCVKHNYTNKTIILNPDEKKVKASMKTWELDSSIPVYNSQMSHLKDSGLLLNPKHQVITEFLPEMGAEIHQNIQWEFPQLALAKAVRMNLNYPIAVIGDSHECVKELKQLIFRLRQKNKDVQIYLCGDFIDKGGNTLDMIDYLIANPDIKLIVGNHEEYVYKALAGLISSRDKEMEAKHFTSLQMLDGNNEYTNKFNILYKRCLPFATLSHPNISAFFTHSPCFNKQLGKMDKVSLMAQRKQRYDWGYPAVQQVGYLSQEANNRHPFHVFGHIVIDKFNHVIKNKIAIDQGCAEGGYLTAFYIDTKGQHSFVYEASSTVKQRDLDCFPKHSDLLPQASV